jgi:hypothetical protein
MCSNFQEFDPYERDEGRTMGPNLGTFKKSFIKGPLSGRNFPLRGVCSKDVTRERIIICGYTVFIIRISTLGSVFIMFKF